MKELLERIKFALSKKPFLYKNGKGYYVESYNPIDDQIYMRFSEFGYVVGYSHVSRGYYETLKTEIGKNTTDRIV